MNGHRSYHKYKFLKFYKNHKIKVVSMPPYTTHLLQLLDVYMFQLLKHWHLKAVNEEIQNNN